jgi:hypothetical protein
VIHLLTTAIWRVSGVSTCVASSSIEEMRPSSVSFPVATTTEVAVPWVTSVPPYTMLVLSATGVPSSTGSVPFSAGTDSPVSADSSA